MTKKFHHVSSLPLPYTTKTGVQIGIAYQRPPQQMTHDGEFIQSVLLGKRTPVLLRNGMMWYATGVMCLFLFIAAVVGK